MWGSFRGRDHFRVNLGFISGLGIISGLGSFRGLYSPTGSRTLTPKQLINPLRSNSDQRQISLCNINTFSVREVMAHMVSSNAV